MYKTPSHAVFNKTDEQNICNICLKKQDRLTLDHVPPKAALPFRRVKVKPLFTGGRAVGSQSGVKYRTVCETCNNKRLGGDYDPALVTMCQRAKWLIRARHTLVVPQFIEIEPAKVLRSVLGHLLAATDHTPRSARDEHMRAFFEDESSTDLGPLHVFYWAHPDHSIRVMRNTGVVEFFGPRGGVVCDLLVWFPLGFVVASAAPSDKVPVFNVPRMNDYLHARGPIQVPLVGLESGAFERWFNRTAKVTGAPGNTAYQAEH